MILGFCRNGVVESLNCKAYPEEISVNMLAELTGRDRRTITDKLKDLTPVAQGAAGNLYDIRAAIRMIFDFNPDDDEQKVEFENDLQPQLEKAKLDFIRRQAVELELEERRRNLIPKEEIKTGLEQLFSNIRAKLRGLPARAAQRIVGPPQKETEALLSKIVDEALTELAEGRFDE